MSCHHRQPIQPDPQHRIVCRRRSPHNNIMIQVDIIKVEGKRRSLVATGHDMGTDIFLLFLRQRHIPWIFDGRNISDYSPSLLGHQGDIRFLSRRHTRVDSGNAISCRRRRTTLDVDRISFPRPTTTNIAATLSLREGRSRRFAAKSRMFVPSFA